MASLNRDNIFDKISNYLKNINAFEVSSTLFGSLEADYQRVAVAYSILERANLLPPCKIKESKSSSKAEVYRNEGNSAFGKKQDIDAIKCYTQSVAFAPFGSKELSLALANRSAVTHSLCEYTNSVTDIDAALKGDYPEHLKYKLFERKGKCFKKLGMVKKAKDNFLSAIKWLEKSILEESKKNIIREDLKNEIKTCSNKDRHYQEIRSPKRKLKVSYSLNTELTSASSAMKVEYVKHLGRYVVATRDIFPGDVLLVEKPYASYVLPQAYLLYCYKCHLRCHALIPCTKCTLVLYCSEACRNESWAFSHEVECEILPSFISFGFSFMELFPTRILITAINEKGSLENLIQEIPEIEKKSDERTKGFGVNGTYVASDYRTMHHLVGNNELRNNSDLFRRSVAAACMVHFIDKCTTFFTDNSEQIIVPNFKVVNIPDILKSNRSLSNVKIFVGGLLMRYLQSLPSNAHEITEMNVTYKGGEVIKYDSYEMGGAAYTILSLINHSCDPNVVRHSYNGDTAVLTAIQFISKGQQIFDSYGYHHAVHDLQTRQTNLLRQYYFKCDCIACQEDWPLYKEMPIDNPVYYDLSLQKRVEKSSEEFKKVLSDILAGNIDGKLQFLYKHLTLLQKAIKRPWKQYSECQEAIKQCLAMQANHYVIHTL